MLKQTVSMYTRDRVRLDADVYYPDAEGEFPVLLMRQPYGRAIASTVVYAHPSWYAAQGYIVVIQDVRGRGTSEGEFKLFEHEIEDGFDTVNWAATLPRSNGKVGMYGFSYQGMTQLYAALNRPEPLKTICPAMLAPNLQHDWAYENGAFCLFANLGWAIQLAAETARLKGDEVAFLELSQAAKNMPLSDLIPAYPEVMQKYAQYDAYYQDWLNSEEAYWQKLTPDVSSIELPMLHIGGWFDTYMRGTLRSYQASSKKHLQHLIVGVWAHLPWGRKVGAIDYGADAVSFCDRAQIRWFDHFLKGSELTDPPVQLFEMGSNQWRSFSEFPHSSEQLLFLNSSGLAGMDDREGKLTTQQSNSAIDVIVHDPWRPVPALGGHVAYPCGSFERSAIDARSDVLTYTTDPLETDLHIAGEIVVELYASSDAASFDLCAVLSEVQPNGSVMNFSQGYLRSENSERAAYRIVLQPTCIRIRQGSAIRLSVSGACFPAYAVNAGIGKKPKDARAIEFQIITIELYSGESSQIRLPILPE
ncbi:peptidase S15 [Leptolyngbya boryana NIES-2135]|jgi:putative CocE/NonD family hydrolase|uniref:Peptidase S15 n=1 Tax=Leptolyngbya boryana NIES-2135 TaxID=1973484 RepID=A0A1Z4JM24_LEPBY|nr:MULTISPECIES: CocE/NonD family hydrolase [Leptolyngbya]ULP28778.1 CocE/NonD family hydrolase [Leptolyngbya boryana IU 594]BAS56161.1 peptidase S15 [Leptolyngbya boryana IAM M-101]BAS62509.1 peptidase S15 [Leptolyngbya boryana dg5]BAY57667.1 peptidase S15 [Leptolyngbya boryana NIES-2135]